MRRDRPRIATLALLCGGLAFCGGAQAAGDGEAKVRGQISAALAGIEHARCGGTAYCTPATPEEIAAPPVSVADGTQALERGIVSGLASACAMDWRALSYRPLAERWRAERKNDRQVALLDILHGMAFGRTLAAVGNKPCTDALRQDIRAQLSTLP